jgi:NADH-quinone oxidoreductase subunit G
MGLKNKINFFDLKLVGALTSKPYAFSARSWELEKLDFIDFYDGMLSNIAIDVRGLSIMRVLPRINENLNEEWISDKIRFSYDSFRRQRLLTPMYKNVVSNNFDEITWEEAFFVFFFNYNLKNYDFLNLDSSLEVLYGKFLDLESLTASKDFFNGFRDSNIKLNYSDYALEDNYFSSNFLLNFNMTKLNNIDFSLIIGSNLRFENPVIHLKLLRLSNQGVPLFTFACSSNAKFKNYSLGNSFKNYLKYLSGKSKYSLLISKSKKPIVFLGESLKQRKDGSSVLRILNSLKLKNLQLSYIYTNVSKIGGLALGIFDNMLNTRLFNAKSVKNNILFLHNADDIEITKFNYSFIVYQGHHGDKGSLLANLILPSTFLLEKKGTFLNMEGSYVKFNFIMKPGLLVRSDWRIYKALSLYFENKLTLIKNNFIDLSLNCFEYLPNFFKHKEYSIFNNKEIVKYNHLRINNTLFYSFYIEYFLSDNVSRASRVMSVSAVKFKNYFFNF